MKKEKRPKSPLDIRALPTLVESLEEAEELPVDNDRWVLDWEALRSNPSYRTEEAAFQLRRQLTTRMRQYGLTLDALAEEIGVPSSKIERLLEGKIDPLLRILAQLSIALNCGVGDFFHDSQEDTSNSFASEANPRKFGEVPAKRFMESTEWDIEEEEVYVCVPPRRTYTATFEIVSIRKGQPLQADIVEEEW